MNQGPGYEQHCERVASAAAPAEPATIMMMILRRLSLRRFKVRPRGRGAYHDRWAVPPCSISVTWHHATPHQPKSPPSSQPQRTPTTEYFFFLSLKINDKVCGTAPSARTPTNPRTSLMKSRTRIHLHPGAAVQGRAPKYAAGPLPPHLHCPSSLDCAASLCVSAPSAPSHGVY
jgi:hypothetical protein